MTVLKDVCELIVDCPHSTAPDEGAGFPIIRTPNVGLGYLTLDNVQRVGKAAYDLRNARAVPKEGDLILAREAPAGNVGIIRGSEKVCLGQRTVLIRPNRKHVVPEYLNYYLNAPAQRHGLLKNANGATVSHVNLPIIRNLPVKLPDMQTQQRIASILSAYDELIESNRKQIILLEEAASRLYKEWFVDFRFPEHESASILGDLPEGWRRITLFDAVDVFRGTSYASENLVDFGDYLMVNLANIRPFGGYRYGKEKQYSGAVNEVCMVSAGDLIIGLTEQAEGLAGYAGLVPTLGQRAFISADIARIAPKNMPVSYLYCVLRFGGLSRALSSLANGAKIKHLKLVSLQRVVISVPPSVISNRFAKVVDNLFSQCDELQSTIASAAEARNRLLPKLMSEESRFNDAEEPIL